MGFSDITRDDDFDYDESEFAQCPRCSGFGEVDCHCGGDLCVCMNNGSAICPLCGGDGEVSEETYQKYEQKQREWAEAFRKAREASNV